MPSTSSPHRYLYWLAALASAAALVLAVLNGATWSRQVIFASLAVLFTVLGRYPVMAARPRWAMLLAGALMLLTLGLLVLRLGGQLA